MCIHHAAESDFFTMEGDFMSTRFHVTGVAALALLGSTLAWAQAAPKEPALAIAATDSQLQWGPCPAFMPSGCRLAVLHGNPAKPNADVFLKVPAGNVLPNHWHTSAERIVLISGELKVTYDSQAPATLTPGTYAYIPAKYPHAATCTSSDPCVLFIAFEEPVDAIPSGHAGHH